MKPKLELHRNHKIYLGLAGLLLAGAGAASWFTLKECRELDEQAAQLREQVDQAKKKILGIDDLETEVIVLRENVEGYIRILPSDAEVTNFTRTVDSFQKESGITIQDLKPQLNRARLSSSAIFDKAEWKLKFTATYRQFLQFIARLENHERFISIAEVKLKAGEQDEKTAGEPVHDVDLSLVTYLYLGDDVGKGRVTINGYDRKREKLGDRIAEARQELEPERFTLLSDQVRRDPLVDPRMRRTKDRAGGQGLEDQRATLNRLVSRLQEAGKLFDSMAQMFESKNFIREMEFRVQATNLLAEVQGQVDEAGARGLMTDPALRKEWDKKVVAELARLRTRAGEPADGKDGARTALGAGARMQQALALMKQHWEAGDYASCAKDYELIHNGSQASADPKLVELQNEMERLYLAAQTAVEFGKKKIEVTGFVVQPGADSVAIINHTVYRAGEAIEDDLVLLEIHEDHLVFEYRGVPLTFDL